ncbi:orotidine-5'-phosphate decarboxylase [Polymorphobacter fuscus]|uniref:Orotidine 5'-phosphate decarboxylase n=1 Tax=Sandarakinorhabdus fusca TaxID=1439888 RepID=A0A7C9GQQ4_9SPHN|nr:orotidine-5'-phosphate decarboxylase [Polymorphobacter fuscus]KAB7645452.1 orotidine-5'-phosphate decarboxylase [Polymorphobacter fuscus]MQT17876.1 orotidine-5'-phosphate decarboxylase [Polymorphobacter fuscus]NJC08505.1 orotidine-5'-phosphate decarboxylase [Polymorphobacter fuscus]
MTNPVFVAIDLPDLAAARTLAAAVAPHVGGLKLGLEFFCAQGPAGVAAMAALGLPLFLDLKLHDIPNTVAGALHSLAGLAPAIVTVHAAGGHAMLAAARAAAPAATKVVAVTVLTSLDDGDLSAIGVAGGTATQVARLAALVRAAGLDGVVASPHETAAVRAAWSEALIVVPGVRPAGSAVGDQKRVMTPREARAAGASVLVIGRPITAAADPVAAAAAIARDLS